SFIMGRERQDVIQEGLTGLNRAICNYDVTAQASFRHSAQICITRQTISSDKTATRQKHSPFNSYVSHYKPTQDHAEHRIIETIGDIFYMDPPFFVERKERINSIRYTLMKTLTNLEWEVLGKYVDGYSYKEISKHIHRREKTVDNAIQRIKRKVGAMIEEY